MEMNAILGKAKVSERVLPIEKQSACITIFEELKEKKFTCNGHKFVKIENNMMYEESGLVFNFYMLLPLAKHDKDGWFTMAYNGEPYRANVYIDHVVKNKYGKYSVYTNAGDITIKIIEE